MSDVVTRDEDAPACCIEHRKPLLLGWGTYECEDCEAARLAACACGGSCVVDDDLCPECCPDH